MGLIITRGYGAEFPVGPGGNPFYVVSHSSTFQYIDLVFNLDVATLTLEAADPAFWVLSTTGAYPITATSVIVTASNTVRLYYTEPKAGDSYSVQFPVNGLKSTANDIYDGPPTYGFIGAAQAPAIAIAQSIDSRHVRVIFSEPVMEVDALVLGNYSFDNGLIGLGVVKETSSTYIVTTTPQTVNLVYTVTCSNIRDSSGNPL